MRSRTITFENSPALIGLLLQWLLRLSLSPAAFLPAVQGREAQAACHRRRAEQQDRCALWRVAAATAAASEHHGWSAFWMAAVAATAGLDSSSSSLMQRAAAAPADLANRPGPSLRSRCPCMVPFMPALRSQCRWASNTHPACHAMPSHKRSLRTTCYCCVTRSQSHAHIAT